MTTAKGEYIRTLRHCFRCGYKRQWWKPADKKFGAVDLGGGWKRLDAKSDSNEVELQLHCPSCVEEMEKDAE